MQPTFADTPAGRTPTWEPAGATPTGEGANALFGGIGRYRGDGGVGGYGGTTTGARPTAPSSRVSRSGRTGGGGSRSMMTFQTAMPTMDRPTMSAIPAYQKAEIDQGRISELQELAMGVPMGQSRRALNRAMIEARYSDNPNVRAMARKKALSGYGEAIGQIRRGAMGEAMGRYQPEYAAEVEAKRAQYQAGVMRTQAQFSADMQEFMGTFKTIQTTMPATGEAVAGFQPAMTAVKQLGR